MPADGGTVAEYRSVLRDISPGGCRAGYRSAEDLASRCSSTRSWWNSWWKCRRPHPALRYCSGLWSSTSTFQFLLVEGETLVFKVFSQNRVQLQRFLLLNAISERIMEQIVDFPVARGGLHDFRPGQSSSSVAHSPAAWLNTEDEPFQEVFRTFSRKKKVRLTPGTWVRECPGTSAFPRRLPVACAVGVDDDTGETWTLLTDPALGSWWYSLEPQMVVQLVDYSRTSRFPCCRAGYRGAQDRVSTRAARTVLRAPQTAEQLWKCRRSCLFLRSSS